MTAEFHVSITIIDEDCSPDEISRFTGLKPTSIWLKGQLVPKTSLYRKHNGWRLKSPLSVESTLADHVNYLLTAVEPFSEKLKEFTSRCSLLLTCAVYFYEEMPELYMDQQTITRLANLNLGLDIDLYYTGSSPK